MDRRKILIIDDSAFVASVYRNKLGSAGYEVHVAGDGESGLALLDRVHPDLVVLDLGLPRMDGHEVLRRIRAQARFAQLPVYVLSGSYGGESVDQAWAAGASGVLCKAAETPNRVVEIIRGALAA